MGRRRPNPGLCILLQFPVPRMSFDFSCFGGHTWLGSRILPGGTGGVSRMESRLVAFRANALFVLLCFNPRNESLKEISCWVDDIAQW